MLAGKGLEMQNESPRDIRQQIRQGKLIRPTCGLAPGFTQANLVVLPQEYAFAFLLFCQRNPKPCPVLEMLEAGQYEPVDKIFSLCNHERIPEAGYSVLYSFRDLGSLYHDQEDNQERN